MNQAISRYNQFSTGVVEIDIAPDFDLHAGDAIFIDVPDTGGGSTDKLISAKYVIAILKHAIRAGKGVTKLGLVRDSFGRTGKEPQTGKPATPTQTPGVQNPYQRTVSRKATDTTSTF